MCCAVLCCLLCAVCCAQGLPVKTAAGEVVFAPNKQQQRLLTASRIQVEGVTVEDDLAAQQKQQQQQQQKMGGRKGRAAEAAAAAEEEEKGASESEEEGEPSAAAKVAQQVQKVAAEQPGERALLQDSWCCHHSVPGCSSSSSSDAARMVVVCLHCQCVFAAAQTAACLLVSLQLHKQLLVQLPMSLAHVHSVCNSCPSAAAPVSMLPFLFFFFSCCCPCGYLGAVSAPLSVVNHQTCPPPSSASCP